MKIILILLAILLTSCVYAQKIKNRKISKKEIDNIDFSTQKINFKKSGREKMSKCFIGDTIIIAEIVFLIGNESSSYFPRMPVIFMDKVNNKYFFKIDHLPLDKQKLLVIKLR